MSTTASHLVRQGHKPKPSTVTFDVSEDDADVVGGRRIYTFPLPPRSGLDVRFDVGSFATQGVEPNVTSEENKVRWTEGIALSTGEEPTVLSNSGDSNGVPVFSHEIAILEGDSYTCFKLGVPPKLNEVNSHVMYISGNSLDKKAITFRNTAIQSTNWFLMTNGGTDAHDTNYSAPHYGKVMQNFVAAGHATDMKLELVNVTAARPINCLDTAAINFGPVSDTATAETDISAAGSTAFNIADSTLLTSGRPVGYTKNLAVMTGFIACSNWFVSDIVDFLNFQLLSVTDSQYNPDSNDTNAAVRGCTTTSTRPANSYRFEQVGGRVQLVRTSGTTAFTVAWNTDSAGNFAYHSIQDPTGAGTNDTKVPSETSLGVCPTGHAPKNTSNLWSALGFNQSTPGTFTRVVSIDLKGTQRTTDAYGFRAASDHAGIFEASIDPAHYTAQTFADAISAAMNLNRNVGTTAMPNAPTAAFVFTDSTNVTRTAVITAGHRTPHQLAEAVGFVLNRLDARGVYAQTQENFTTHDGDARLNRQERDGSIAEADKLLWYRVVYDKDTKKFTIENREIASYLFSAYDASDSFTYPQGGTDEELLSTTGGIPVVQYPSTTTRAPFSISFRTADLQFTSVLSGTTLSTATAARLLGFVPQRVYTGSQLTSEVETGNASHPTLLTRGMRNDASSVVASAQRPLDSAAWTSAPYFYHNTWHLRGSGPDSHVYPRYAYTVSGSQYNDKQYTVTARQPPCAASASINPLRTSSTPAPGHADDLVVDTTLAASSTMLTAAGPKSGSEGTRYKANTLVVVDDSTGAPGTGSAIATITATDSSNPGQVSTLSVLYQSEGAETMAAEEAAFQINADGPLRIVDGYNPVNTYFSDSSKDSSRIIVHCGLAAETFGTYRTTQGCLPFQVGDVVELGANASVIYDGSSAEPNFGRSVVGHVFNITRVTAGGTILAATTAFTAGTGDYVLIQDGQWYRVMQGDCLTVIEVAVDTALDNSSTSYDFVFINKGSGHFIDATVKLFGPIPHVLTGVVEEVMQVPYRHEYGDVPDLEAAFTVRKTHRDTSNALASFTSSSLARDGSLLKIRLAHNCIYLPSGDDKARPSNLTYIRPWEPVRFQLLNHADDPRNHFRKSDTVWHMFGADDDSAIGSSIKAAREWDLSAGAGITLTMENDVGVPQVHDYVVRGQITHKVLAKVDYNSALSRTWGVVHAREYSSRNLKEIKIRVLDRFLRDYDFKGRPFTITFNLHSF